MNILVTGVYEPEYNRTKIIINGLRKRTDLSIEEFQYNSRRKIDKRKLKEKCDNADIVFLPSFTHADVRFVRKLTKTKIVFDPLISRYLTKVFDYKMVSRFSPRAYKNYLKDKIALNNADIVIADTLAHRDYYSKKFNIDKTKFRIVYVGTDSSDFLDKPKITINDKFRVGFYGGFNPLQGVPKIIETARLLSGNKYIVFEIIGEGFEYKKVRKLEQKYELENIVFHGKLPYKELISKMTQFDICLGIFGDSLKTDIVIPNKIFHYAATGRAAITKDTPAIREIFTPNENIILVQNKPEEIAKAIVELKNNTKLRDKIAANALNIVTAKYNEDCIADAFISGITDK